jgi:hypothetical protein
LPVKVLVVSPNTAAFRIQYFPSARSRVTRMMSNSLEGAADEVVIDLDLSAHPTYRVDRLDCVQRLTSTTATNWTLISARLP